MREFKRNKKSAEEPTSTKATATTAIVALTKKAKAAAASIGAGGNFITWKDLEEGQFIIFPLDGTLEEKKVNQFTFLEYRPSKIVLFDESGKPTKKMVETDGKRPSIPAPTALVGSDTREGYLKEAADKGHKFALMCGHVFVEAGTTKDGRNYRQHHKFAFESEPAGASMETALNTALGS